MDEGKMKRRKPFLKRTRTGCFQCRQRRKKCDQAKPSCTSCGERGWTCEYPVPTDGPTRANTPCDPLSPRRQSVDGLASAIVGGVPAAAEQPCAALVAHNTFPVSSPINPMAQPFYNMLSFSALPSVPGAHLNSVSSQSLIQYFLNSASTLLAFSSGSDNPFHKYFLPMLFSSHQEGAMERALYAFASKHRQQLLPELALAHEEGAGWLTWQTKAVEGLMEEIRQSGVGGTSEERTLSTILLLVYTEIADGGGGAATLAHLKGAFSIIRNSPPSLGTQGGNWRFLKKIFWYFDIVAALCMGTCPLSDAMYAQTASQLVSKGEAVDDVFGLSGSLWPIIAKLCRVAAAASGQAMSWGSPTVKHEEDPLIAAAQGRAYWLSEAEQLEQDFLNWQQPGSNTADPEWHSVVQAAEAWRYAALIYLYRRLYNLPACHMSVQGCVTPALNCLSKICTFGGRMAALLWPVVVVACECVTQSDRALAMVVLDRVGRVQGMGNVVKAKDVVRRAWDRGEAPYNADVSVILG
ncbi:hypothetical protein YB2330_006419 [Saitoella coloradoensis]